MRVPLNELLYSLSRALDFVEQELLGVTTNHGKRAAYFSAYIAKAMGLNDEDIFDMACCAILHDNALTAYMLEAGPEGISRLERFEQHCRIGENHARAFPFAGDAKDIILYHHENWNGSGFHALAGDDIPLRAAILRTADVMDLKLKMSDGRNGLAGEIRKNTREFSGKLYAPRVAEALNDTLTVEFLEGLSDGHIDGALRALVPPVRSNLAPKQMLDVCSIFAFIIDAKSPFTCNHSNGVAEKAGRVAETFRFNERHKDKLMVAGYLHDVGKLSTPLGILEKAGALDSDEFLVMKKHVAVTEDILADVKGLEDVTLWGASHHETLDGKGYHRGLGAADIPLEGRILACCDIFQALTEDRPYRKGMGLDEAFRIMDDMAARGKLDKTVVQAVRESFSFSEPRGADA